MLFTTARVLLRLASLQTTADMFNHVAAANAPEEPVKPPLLARLPLVGGALDAVTTKVKQFIAAKEQHLVALSGMTAHKDVPDTEKLVQQWQVSTHE